MPETEDISKLASILHQNGDKVLSALSKLSLNATLLQKINKEFELFLESSNDTDKFQVLPSGNTSSQVLQDLHFLYDFIQKTVGLKITNSANLSLLDNKVDISKFKSIKYLEVKKVPVKEIVGLKVIQSQLESVVCIKCLSRLEELLAECGGDNSVGFVWSELKEAVISYNNIKVLDTSIAFAPWLQVLDLSHNKLVNVQAIECLPNLKYINLSFNCLSSVPSFSKSARKKLLVLVIKNNYIEDLSGLAGLGHLTELDVSWNWVSNHECLHPLLTMSALQNLSLKGNPIYYHKGYKQNVVGYLHISASLSDFVLDGSKLSKKYKGVVGFKLCQPGRPAAPPSPEESVFYTSSVAESPSEENKGSSAKKSGKVRLAAIPNLDDGTYEEIPADISGINFKESVSMEHLIMKKKIEDARAMYGSDWLRCEAASVVQDVLGLPPSEPLSSTPLEDICLQAALNAEDNTVITKAIIENCQDPADAKVDLDSFATCTEGHPSTYYSVETQDEKTEEKSKENAELKETSPEFELIQESSEEVEDENEKVYLVSRIKKVGKNEPQAEELFLTLSEVELKEKDSNRGKEMNKWSLSSLESCVKLQSNKLQLNFDTVKRDKAERIYEMEEAEAYELYKILTEILESRTLQDMNQIAYKCVTCSSQFSKMINRRKQEENTRCPFCNSKIILEIDDHSPPEKPVEVKAKEPQTKSAHNRSSSAGVIQGISQNANKVVKCSSQSSIGSAASLDELVELPGTQGTKVKRSDSDIEILSNPSQSSIEVIDGPSRISGSTPRRKQSEERQVVKPLSETVPQIGNVGLTESSSSGSVTDSVCTAYENSGGSTAMTCKSDNNNVSEETKDIAKIMGRKMFETVVEETVKDNSRKAQRKTHSMDVSDGIQYSYTDFTKIDHRIKLLLYSQIFEDNNEEYSFIIRCTVFLTNSSTSFESCVVFSNKKLYILKVIGPEEGYDASKFLQKTNSLRFDLKSVKSISVLAWSQGFSIKLQDTHDKLKEFLILLKDRKRTQSLLKFLQTPDLSLPDSCHIVTDPSQKPLLAMQHLLVSGASEDSGINFFSLIHSCYVISYTGVEQIENASILTNSTDLLLFSSEPKWLCDGSEQPPQPVFSQKLSNLMSVEVANSRLYLQFMDESNEREEVWDITMMTTEGAKDITNSVNSSWEDIFSVPLQVSYTGNEA
ncbi:UNVERIFIED_CONTAM: hypothetical protein PYX00_008281 [Menopon gallinae]|uniref:Serine/threonine-protein kinase 11-interacting protein n=1 Tax=Menopon gallinae TaxID=328185 RepID=A0AAW2HMB5_9NEOP